MKFQAPVHHRQSARLKGYDYSQAGAYFITICCHRMLLRFGAIDASGKGGPIMNLNEFGEAAHNNWVELSARFSNIDLDVFQIMPNHMHGIIFLKTVYDGPGASDRAGASPAPSVSDIIGAYKSIVANECLRLFKEANRAQVASSNISMGKLWQRNFHDHIIRDAQSYHNIANYIINNPRNWKADRFFNEQ